MKRKFLWVGLSFLLVVSLVLASCAKEVPGEQEEEEEEEVFLEFPRSETLFTEQLTGRNLTPDNFNNWVGWKNQDRGMQQLMNEPLWTIAYTTGEVINSLASGPPEYNEDFTEMTIKLREGVYWSDGVEFTADDVVFTIETIRDTPGMNYNSQLQEVERVYAADRYTVVVELIAPNARFNTYFVDRWGCCWIMPKHVFQSVAAEGAEALLAFEYSEPLSLGAYVLHSYDPLGFWTAWERRGDWERTPTGMLYGQSVPKYVVIVVHADPAARVIAMACHELDDTNVTIEGLRAVLAKNPYSRGYQLEFPWVENIHPCITGLVFNTLKPPFDNPDVRWALTLAIDIVSYTVTAYDGAATVNPLLLPLVSLYIKHYYEPMEEWLLDFTLDIGDGKTFKPYDPDAAYGLAEHAKVRGYAVPEDIKGTFGVGWWKYAPDIAARLLEKNGFTRDEDGKWLLPDGTPWKIELLTGVTPGSPPFQNVFAAAREWRKFGIDVTVVTHEMAGTMTDHGEFDVGGSWPAIEPWGGHIDLYRTFDPWHSAYVEPVLGEQTWGHASRWSDPRMDEIIDELKFIDWGDIERMVPLGIAGLKVTVEEMPGIPTFMYPSIIAWDTYYWTNWPGAENAYCQPHSHWPNFKYMLPFLEPTGR